MTGAQVEPVEAGIDAEGGGEAAGAAGEVTDARGAAAAGHQGRTLQGLDGAQQDAGADAGMFARHVEAEPAAIDEIDIGVAAVEKERTVAAGLAAEGMAAGIADDIGLGLDDAATGAAVPAVMDQDAADEEAGQRHRLGGEILPAEPARHRNDGKRLINQCRTRRLPWREATLCDLRRASRSW